MELQNAPFIARFIMGLFILLVLLAFIPMLNNGVLNAKENLSCDEDYGVICFLVSLTLPFLVLLVVGLFIMYMKGGS